LLKALKACNITLRKEHDVCKVDRAHDPRVLSNDLFRKLLVSIEVHC